MAYPYNIKDQFYIYKHIGNNKMNHKFLLSTILLLLLVAFYVPNSFSTNPTFTQTLTNDIQTSDRIYEFDVYMLSTDVNPIQLASTGLSMRIDNAVLNGGTVTLSWVDGSTQLTNTTQLPSFSPIVSGSYYLIRCPGATPPGAGNGSMITTVPPGTKIGRLRITNSVAFAALVPNLAWATALYPAAVNAYINNVNTTITSSRTLTVSLTNPALPVELSSFTSSVNGRQVNLNWETKTEVNSNQFEIDRALQSSKDASLNWVSVGTVKASGLSNSTKDYSYSDTKLQSGKYHYRIKMVDNNGSFSYSSVEVAEVAIPKDFAVSQNYPNPFNPSTKIDYQVPVDAKVVMEVYNITGQKVMELVNQQMSAGYYTVDFGASKLSSGVYIYRLAASDKATGHNFSSIKKMMLLK